MPVQQRRSLVDLQHLALCRVPQAGDVCSKHTTMAWAATARTTRSSAMARTPCGIYHGHQRQKAVKLGCCLALGGDRCVGRYARRNRGPSIPAKGIQWRYAIAAVREVEQQKYIGPVVPAGDGAGA